MNTRDRDLPSDPALELSSDQELTAEEKLKRAELLQRVYRQAELPHYQEWIKKLTVPEIESLEKLGFYIQLLVAVIRNPGVISIPKYKAADEDESRKFTFTEIGHLMEDIESEAHKFLGREKNRIKTPDTRSLRLAYRKLVLLTKEVEFGFRMYEDERSKLQTQFVYERKGSADEVVSYDDEFLEIISTLPQAFSILTDEMNDPAQSSERLVKERVKSLTNSLSRNIGADEKEKELILKAMETIKQMKHKIRLAKVIGQKNILRLEDLQGLIDTLGAMDLLRRDDIPIYVPDEKVRAQMNSKTYGLNEIYRLLKVIDEQKDQFVNFENFEMGKIAVVKPKKQKIRRIGAGLLEEDESPQESDNEREARIEREKEELARKEEALELEKAEKKDQMFRIIENSAVAFKTIFPDPLAPFTVRRYQEVISRRLAPYRNLASIVRKIEDKKARNTLEYIIYEIGQILAYLDCMWDMHQIEKNGDGTHIVYPKKMLLLAPLIIENMEELMGRFNIWSSEGLPEPNQQEVSPRAGVGERLENNSAVFRLAEKANEDITNVLENGGEAKNEEKDEGGDRMSGFFGSEDFGGEVTPTNPYSRIFDTLGFIFGYGDKVGAIPKARQTLRSVRVKKMQENAENDSRTSETLSYHIHDFIRELRYAMHEALYQIAREFNPALKKKDVIPEQEGIVEQAAKLQREIFELGTHMSPVKNLINHAIEGSRNNDTVDILVIRSELTQLSRYVRKFQELQEQSLNDKEYHGVQPGEGFGKTLNFTKYLVDFTGHHLDELTPDTINILHINKCLKELAKDIERSSQTNSALKCDVVNAWKKDMELLELHEQRLQANNLSPEQLQREQKKYVESFLHVLNVMHDISRLQEIKHFAIQEPVTEPGKRSRKTSEIPAEIKVYEVPKEIAALFADFLVKNPFAADCDNSHFSPVYHKFLKLSQLLEDFQTECEMHPTMEEQAFLQEFYAEKEAFLKAAFHKVITTDLKVTTADAYKDLKVMLEECREALGHLKFRGGTIEKLDQAIVEIDQALQKYWINGKRIPDMKLQLQTLSVWAENGHQPF